MIGRLTRSLAVAALALLVMLAASAGPHQAAPDVLTVIAANEELYAPPAALVMQADALPGAVTNFGADVAMYSTGWRRQASARKAAAAKARATREAAADPTDPNREPTTEEKKALGQTKSQQQIKDYHEGEFQTHDPITGEKRELDQPLKVARVDRGETIEDVAGDDDA